MWDSLKLLGITGRDQLVASVDDSPGLTSSSAIVGSGSSFEWSGSYVEKNAAAMDSAIRYMRSHRQMFCSLVMTSQFAFRQRGTQRCVPPYWPSPWFECAARSQHVPVHDAPTRPPNHEVEQILTGAFAFVLAYAICNSLTAFLFRPIPRQSSTTVLLKV